MFLQLNRNAVPFGSSSTVLCTPSVIDLQIVDNCLNSTESASKADLKIALAVPSKLSFYDGFNSTSARCSELTFSAPYIFVDGPKQPCYQEILITLDHQIAH